MAGQVIPGPYTRRNIRNFLKQEVTTRGAPAKDKGTAQERAVEEAEAAVVPPPPQQQDGDANYFLYAGDLTLVVGILVYVVRLILQGEASS